MSDRALPRSVYFALLLLTLGWGINWPMLKMALSGMGPFTFRTYCVLTGAGAMFLAARVVKLDLRVPAGKWPALWLCALFNITFWNILTVYGVQQLASGRAAVLAYTMPVWTIALSAWFLNEKLTLRRLTGLTLGICAMALLLVDDLSRVTGAPVGTLLMISAALTWAIGTVLLKRLAIGMPTVALTAWQLLLGGVPIIVLKLWLEPDQLLPTTNAAWIGLAYNMIVSYALCHWAWFKIVDSAPAGVASLATLMIPVVGVISGMLVLGEQPRWQEYAGLVLVTAALVTVLVPRGFLSLKWRTGATDT